jgi:hypothetical protein
MTHVFQVNFMTSHRLKGKWSPRRRQGFHSTPLYYLSFAVTPHRSSLWYNPSLVYYLPKGREFDKGSYFTHKYPFLAIHAKGGESISPKQKDRTTTNFKKCVNVVFQLILKKFFNWYLIFDIISNWYGPFQN